MSRAIISRFILQLGLALTFVYAGVDMLLHPELWLGWLPLWLSAASPLKDTPLLYTIGTAHVLLSIFLFVPKYWRVSSALLALYLVGVLASSTPATWIIVFRDIGLLAAAITLTILPSKPKEPTVAAHALHVSAICLRQAPEGGVEVLAGKRSTLKRHYPAYWEGSAGGALHAHEDFPTAALRHLREDYGVEARVLVPVAPFEIPAKGKDPRVLGIKFLCEFTGYTNGKEVALDQTEYSEWRWLALKDKLDELAWIPGTPRNAKEDIREAAEIYRRLKQSPV